MTGPLRALAREFGELSLATLTAGLLGGLVAVVSTISLAALIFGGPLAGHLGSGIAMMLITAIAGGLIIALFSSYRGTVAIPQPRVAPILVVLSTAVVAALPEGVSAETRFLSVVAACVLCALVTGSCLALLGWLRLGGFVRYIPYPVIGGVLAGAGWLLVCGSFRVMTGAAPDVPVLELLGEPGRALEWGPGIVSALLMVVIARRTRHFLTVPAVLVASVLAFYGFIAISDVSLAEASRLGWLLGPFPVDDGWRYMTVDAYLAADWKAVLGQWPSVATIALVSVASVLLNASAIEVASGSELHLDRELGVTGLANLAAGALGGVVIFHSMAISMLALRMGARTRALGLIVAAVCALALLVGLGLFEYFPRSVLGALLLFLGSSMVLEWIHDTWSKLSTGDYVVVVLILATVGVAGFIAGVAVGLVGAIILFVVNYSRVDVVKHELTGEHQRSNVDRPARHERYLRDHGGAVYILKLQGFIFFGTANRLFAQVRQRAVDPRGGPLEYVLLDFSRVSAMDSSAALSFTKLRQLAVRSGFTLVLTGLARTVLEQLESGDEAWSSSPAVHRMPDLDHGLEWCEERILEELTRRPGTSGWAILSQQLDDALPDGVTADRLLGYMQRTEVEAGTEIMREGDRADDLYLIESGEVTVSLELGDGKRVRLRKMGPGTVAGELGVYLGGERSASVFTDRPSVLHHLTADALERMRREDPALVAAFHACMARLIAERLVNTNEALRALLD